MVHLISRVLAALLVFGAVASVQAADLAAGDIAGVERKLPAKERAVRVIHFRAPGDAPRPAALMLHGAGGFDRRIADYSRYAAALAGQGIDAFLVYYYSPRDEASGGSMFEARYEAWARLVDDLADHLIKQKESNGKVGLVGFSNGGILATGAAILDPRINAAVVYYGTEPWPLKDKPRLYPPLLILHGDADTVIAVDAGIALADNAREQGGSAELVIYPDEVHGFGSSITSKNGSDALARTIAFLKRELAVK